MADPVLIVSQVIGEVDAKATTPTVSVSQVVGEVDAFKSGVVVYVSQILCEIDIIPGIPGMIYVCDVRFS